MLSFLIAPKAEYTNNTTVGNALLWLKSCNDCLVVTTLINRRMSIFNENETRGSGKGPLKHYNLRTAIILPFHVGDTNNYVFGCHSDLLHHTVIKKEQKRTITP